MCNVKANVYSALKLRVAIGSIGLGGAPDDRVCWNVNCKIAEPKDVGDLKQPKDVGDLKQCSRCHHATYCDASCQKMDWRYHKTTCRSHASRATSSAMPKEGKGVSLDSTLWWEYGEPDRTEADAFFTPGSASLYGHAWLEDCDGNVYDCLSEFPKLAAIHNVRVVGSIGSVAHASTKPRLIVRGFHYRAAPTTVQRLVFQRWVADLHTNVRKILQTDEADYQSFVVPNTRYNDSTDIGPTSSDLRPLLTK
jgi:hypothetical protein